MQSCARARGDGRGGRQPHEVIAEVFLELLRVGVTSVHDALVASDATLVHYATALAAGAPHARVRLSHAECVPRVVASPLPDDDWLQVGGIKLISDGSIQLHTACLSMPYFDRPDECGHMVIDPASLHRHGRRCAPSRCAGRDPHQRRPPPSTTHSTPSSTRLRRHPRRDHRHRLEHSQTVRDDQIARMRRLGVATSLFVNHVYYWGDRHRDRFLGPERAPRIDPDPLGRQFGRAVGTSQ